MTLRKPTTRRKGGPGSGPKRRIQHGLPTIPLDPNEEQGSGPRRNYLPSAPQGTYRMTPEGQQARRTARGAIEGALAQEFLQNPRRIPAQDDYADTDDGHTAQRFGMGAHEGTARQQTPRSRNWRTQPLRQQPLRERHSIRSATPSGLRKKQQEIRRRNTPYSDNQ